MKELWHKLKKLVLLKAKFATTSLVATSVDYGLYLVLEKYFFTPVVANIISYSVAMVLNFLLQKRFVFSLKRSARNAFLLAITVSFGGMILSTGIIYGLNQFPFFVEKQYITKLVATGIVFFYNFYFKRYVFEKRFFTVD